MLSGRVLDVGVGGSSGTLTGVGTGQTEYAGSVNNSGASSSEW